MVPSPQSILRLSKLLLASTVGCGAFLSLQDSCSVGSSPKPRKALPHHVSLCKSSPIFGHLSVLNRREAGTRLLFLEIAPMTIAAKAHADTSSEAPSLSSLGGNTTVRWGIVGLGDVTAVKAGPPFYKCEGSQLVAVMRRTPGAAKDWIEKNMPSNLQTPCRGYDNLDAFLQDPSLDAVYVATPPGAHLEVALQVAAARKPAYIEKPVGRCGWETKAIVQAFQDKGLPLFTAYVSRAYERTRTLIKLLQDEKVVGGQITSIKYTLRGSDMARGLDWTHGIPWRLNAAQSGGGLIMDVGCHVLDRIDYICGPIVNVNGTALNRGSPNQLVEDFVELRGEIGSSCWAALPSEGATVECTWDFSDTSAPVDELVFVGPRGSLKMAAMSPSLPITVLGPDGSIVKEVSFEAPQHAAQPLIQEITNELRGTPVGAKSPSHGDNAIRTCAVLDAALDSYYGGRHDEFWSRPDTWPGRRQNV